MLELKPTEPIRHQSVGIVGAGPAGLITGYTLLQDGFRNVHVLTRDKSPGGVWARKRVYPGVSINRWVRWTFCFCFCFRDDQSICGIVACMGNSGFLPFQCHLPCSRVKQGIAFVART